MLNLDEILKGIGSQMSKSMPSWSNPLQPQVQAPQAFPETNPFGNYLAGQFPEQSPGGFGSFQEQTPGFGAFGERPSSGFGSFPEHQNEALAHVAQAATSATTAAHAGTPSAGDQETEQYIRQAAAQRGIDPETAVKVWGGEGRSNYAGDNGSSYGPYQLHYGGVASGGNSVGGLGDAFTKQTGLDARDPKTWQAQVDFALDNVKNGGWTPFHGAAAQGIGPRQGVGTYSPPPAPQSLAPAAAGAAKSDPHGGRPTQFDSQLTPAEQLAACGPTAAVAMAATQGQNFSVRQALDLAKSRGYWNGQMQGPASEVNLLHSMGVTAQNEGMDWNRVSQEAQAGRPVMIDTPGHYYYIDSFDPHSGSYHVGTSGTDLKGGSEWMTAAQINSMPQSHGPARSIITSSPVAQPG